MEAYDFSTATQQLYGWWQYELCDVFIELMKPVMARDDAQPGAVVNMLAAGSQQDHACSSSCWMPLFPHLRLQHKLQRLCTEILKMLLQRRSQAAAAAGTAQGSMAKSLESAAAKADRLSATNGTIVWLLLEISNLQRIILPDDWQSVLQGITAVF
eukprot:GHUV01045111.1.p2 GENE.GHUV01045111.1~~GHUV01045111.1.p2  ORF type:complete len:156 (-),score=66.59 GHUV01045111.1:169-636(-)